MPRLWLAILFLFLVALSLWAVVGVSEIQHRIAVFAVVGATLTAITSVLTIVINNKAARDRETMLLIRKEQQEVFAHFYTAFFEILKNSKRSGGNQPSRKAIDEMFEFRQGLMNWGTEALITSYLEYEEGLETAREEGPTAMLRIGDQFIRSMRRELGFKDSGSVNIMSVILEPQARRELGS